MSLDNVPIPAIDVEAATVRMERIKSAYSEGVTLQEQVDKLAYLAATMEQQRDQARIEAKLAQEARTASYKEGVKEGLRRYAWWQNGTQHVGTTGTTLEEAISAVEKEEVADA